jgi:hypothetical protein
MRTDRAQKSPHLIDRNHGKPYIPRCGGTPERQQEGSGWVLKKDKDYGDNTDKENKEE